MSPRGGGQEEDEDEQDETMSTRMTTEEGEERERGYSLTTRLPGRYPWFDRISPGGSAFDRDDRLTDCNHRFGDIVVTVKNENENEPRLL